MKIDVIIPTYNRAHVIEKSIESVLNQQYQDFHLYIVNDGSTDETDQILNKYKDHQKITILFQNNKGVSAARNLGIRQSNAEWIAFLDSDDTWLPNKLGLQADYIKHNPNIAFIHTEEIWVKNSVRVNPKIKHRKSGDDLFIRSLDFCLISPSTVLMRRELLMKLGLFNEEFVVCEDYDLWLKVLATEKVGFIDEALTIKTGGHQDQLSTKFFAMDYWRIKSLVNLFNSNLVNDCIKEEIKKVINKKSVILLSGYLKHGDELHYKEISELVLPFA